MKVLVVGLNPSVQSPDCSAFHPSTKSRKTLDTWFDGIEACFAYTNMCSGKMPANQAPSLDDIQRGAYDVLKTIFDTKPDKIIVVGKIAAKYFRRYIPRDFLEIAHPSGMNRKLNDPKYVKSLILKIKEYMNDDR